MANYRDKLQSLNVKDTEVSNRIKGKIKSYHEAESILSKENLSDADREEVNKVLTDLDTEICADIDKWYPQRERFARQAAHLKPRTAGKSKTTNTPKADNADPGVPINPAPEPPAADPVLESAQVPTTDPVVAPAPTELAGEEPKKKSNGFGWLLFGLAVTVLTVGAVSTFKKE